jgi:hypothetical protein
MAATTGVVDVVTREALVSGPGSITADAVVRLALLTNPSAAQVDVVARLVLLVPPPPATPTTTFQTAVVVINDAR